MRHAINVVLAATMLWLFTACRTMTPEVAAFQSIHATGEMADASLKAWASYCKSAEGTPSRIPLSTHLEVKEKWDVYQSFLAQAQSAVNAYKTAYAAWEKAGSQGAAPDMANISAVVQQAYQFGIDFVGFVNGLKQPQK
jgi:hypothetical protein